jgi:hypothetical protein
MFRRLNPGKRSSSEDDTEGPHKRARASLPEPEEPAIHSDGLEHIFDTTVVGIENNNLTISTSSSAFSSPESDTQYFVSRI